MGRTDSDAPGYAPGDEVDDFDPLLDDFISKERKYRHFDRPLSEDARAKVRATDEAILKGTFWPLLGFTKSERRAKRDGKGNISFETKDREIKFGSHADAALLEAYTRRLSAFYELEIGSRKIDSCVLAYRRGCGDNISQAKSLFGEIKVRGEIVAIGVDIKKFFDNIPHNVILRNLATILRSDRISKSDYRIFKRMTAYEWVDADDLAVALSGIKTPPGRICDARQFRDIVRSKNKLININKESFGIPQGTPLSGLYANISLLQFDEDMNAYAEEVGGLYRRYSDDIALLVPPSVGSDAALLKISDLLSGMGLSVAENKTVISRFHMDSGSLSADRDFQYLGFIFNGSRVLIRQSSLNRYYSKMSKGIRSKVRAAKNGGVDRESMFMRQLFKSYTHFGRYRNFPRYAYRAANIMEDLGIRRQVRNHIKIFKKLTKYYLDRAY